VVFYMIERKISIDQGIRIRHTQTPISDHSRSHDLHVSLRGGKTKFTLAFLLIVLTATHGP
jgi:hypothetical protein